MAFCNWLYRNDYVKYSPIDKVDPPKPGKRILPSLSPEQVQRLVDQCGNVRDKAIISLFADSGIRLSELVGIEWENIDFGNNTVRVTGKGNKQRRAPFSRRTEELLKKLPTDGTPVFGLSRRGVMIMLHRLGKKTGLPTNPHTFRRTFASNQHSAGLDVEHIMRLGGWESLDMVLRYTKSVKFEDSLKVYREVEVENGNKDT